MFLSSVALVGKILRRWVYLVQACSGNGEFPTIAPFDNISPLLAKVGDYVAQSECEVDDRYDPQRVIKESSDSGQEPNGKNDQHDHPRDATVCQQV